MKKNLKRIIYVGYVLVLIILSLAACGKKKDVGIKSDTNLFDLEKNFDNKKAEVIYFSAYDSVEDVANRIATALDIEIKKIEPEVPYTIEDLDFDNIDSRVSMEDNYNVFYENIERADDEYETSFGAIVTTSSETSKIKAVEELPRIKPIKVSGKDYIILGYPIWNENVPKVIYTFLRGVKNKTIIPFCVGNDIGITDQLITNYVDDSVRVMSGESFDEGVSEEEIKEWITRLSVDFNIK